MVTTLMAYAQLEVDNSSTCIPRLCKFTIVRLVLNRLVDGSDLNAIVVAVKIQSNKRTFRCCDIPLQQDGTLDVPVNLQYIITYPHYFKRDINKIQIYIQRRKNRPMIGYKTLASGEINLNQIIQQSQSMDLHLYGNINEKSKQQVRSTNSEDMPTTEAQNRPVGYVSIMSLSSTIPNESEVVEPVDLGLTSNRLTDKQQQFEKSFNDDDEYNDEEEINSELEDSDMEFNSKNKQKFNPNVIRNKLIQMFKRKGAQTRNNPSKILNSNEAGNNQFDHQYERILFDRQSDTEEDPPSDISESTIPVDQWSIESVPKPGFTPVEHLQLLRCSEDDAYLMKQSVNNNDSPCDSDTSDPGVDNDLKEIYQEPWPVLELKALPSSVVAIKQLEELYINDRLPESIIFIYMGLNQTNITAAKLKECNLSVVALNTLSESKGVFNNLIQRIQKCSSQAVIRIVLLGDDAFINSFLQAYVECLTSRPHEYMACFRFYFVPLVPSYLAKFLGSLDPQYEVLFGNHEPSDVRDLSQKIVRYLKTSQRTLSLPVGEVMLNRKGKLSDDDSSPTFLPFFCYVRLGTFSLVEDNAQVSASLSTPIVTNHPERELKDASDDENNQLLSPTSPQSKLMSNLIKTSATDDSSALPFDLSIDYWTIIDNQKDKKDGVRTIKSSLKANIHVLTITRQSETTNDGKISPALTMTYITREKRQKIMKFGKKLNKIIERQEITGINRLVCTSKSQNIVLKVNIDGQEWDDVKFFQISSQWHTHIKYFPLALFNDIRNP
ncbi:unnamed protein product [Adineta ricciae]|uniref:Uncharacterized protein n=1 Tax=Adineta ricciae TaxID=249248 RepID=A0A815W3L3_ADIRI|nr:unnamed protein product [Adineta ricciae]